MTKIRKIIFVLVEGPTDKTALSKILENILKENTVYIYVEYGDITTRLQPPSSRETILSRLGERLSEFVERSHIRFSDILHSYCRHGWSIH